MLNLLCQTYHAKPIIPKPTMPNLSCQTYHPQTYFAKPIMPNLSSPNLLCQTYHAKPIIPKPTILNLLTMCAHTIQHECMQARTCMAQQHTRIRACIHTPACTHAHMHICRHHHARMQVMIDRHVVVKARLSKLLRLPEGRLFGQLLDLLKFYEAP